MGTAEVLEAEQPPEPEKPKRIRYGRRIPTTTPEKTAQIVERLHKGEAVAQISRAVNINPRVVRRIEENFREVFKALPEVEGYRQQKSDLLDAMQLTALKAVARTADNPTLQMHQAASAFKILNDAGRLERGQSTKNIMVFSRIVTTTDE